MAIHPTLTAKEQLFVSEFLVDFNSVAALMRMGWSRSAASDAAYRWLRRPHVREAISKAIRRIDAHSTISAVRVIEEVARVALADPRKLYNEDGTLKEVRDLDEDLARAVASVKTTTKPGKDGEPPTHTTEIKLWDKNRATEQLLKSLGKIMDGGGPLTVNQTTLNAGTGALDAEKMRELENQLRAVLGKEPLPQNTPADEQKGSVTPLSPDPEGVDEGDTIEAAQLPDFDGDDPGLDAAFL
mgnify:CR=1 FL=1